MAENILLSTDIVNGYLTKSAKKHAYVVRMYSIVVSLQAWPWP
jgi:hypothetical protein